MGYNKKVNLWRKGDNRSTCYKTSRLGPARPFVVGLGIEMGDIPQSEEIFYVEQEDMEEGCNKGTTWRCSVDLTFGKGFVNFIGSTVTIRDTKYGVSITSFVVKLYRKSMH